MRLAFCDSSALLKLIVAEPESHALETVLQTYSNLATSGLAVVELSQAVRRRDPSLEALVRRLLNRLDIIAVDHVILDLASRLEPPELRSLDAIQLASALALRRIALDFIAYDKQLLQAASREGLRTLSPS
jgi:predicted nucleic acid-binding protein